MYAVVKTGGKQYRVSEGDILHVSKMPVEAGEIVSLEEVMLISKEGEVTIGQPMIEGARVRATVEKHGRGKKIIVYKHKQNYHKKQGHRQDYTRLHIDRILMAGEVEEEVSVAQKDETVDVAQETNDTPIVAVETNDISMEKNDIADVHVDETKSDKVTDVESVADQSESVSDKQEKTDGS